MTLDAEKQRIVQSAVQEVTHIATLPEITVKIIELVEDPNSTAHDLHLVISNDPALCTRVLKVVNSAFYGLPRQIGSINRAIVLLGLNAVKNIAIAASLAKLFRGGRIAPTFSAHDLWAHSIAVGCGVKMLVDKTHMGLPDEAFLCGLIHDIGMMVEIQVLRPKLIEVLSVVEKEGIYFTQAEEKVIGATHMDFGQALCEKWKFPPSFSDVAGYHHRPMELDEGRRTFASLVYVSDKLTARLEMGWTTGVDGLDIDERVKDELKLTDELIDEIIEELPEAVDVASQLLGQ